MHLKPEDQERVAQAYLKDAGNKQLSAERRMKARGEAQRWKALAQGVVSSLPVSSMRPSVPAASFSLHLW
jgi:hypothetical protein